MDLPLYIKDFFTRYDVNQEIDNTVNINELTKIMMVSEQSDTMTTKSDSDMNLIQSENFKRLSLKFEIEVKHGLELKKNIVDALVGLLLKDDKTEELIYKARKTLFKLSQHFSRNQLHLYADYIIYDEHVKNWKEIKTLLEVKYESQLKKYFALCYIFPKVESYKIQLDNEWKRLSHFVPQECLLLYHNVHFGHMKRKNDKIDQL